VRYGLTEGFARDPDAEVRLAAFEWLARLVAEQGDVLFRDTLVRGFEFRGERVPMVGPQGIFKPKILKEVPVSITTSPSGPYDDSFGPGGLLLYRYRGTNPQHHENVGLRKALIQKTPLVYFHGIVPGRYLAVWPVFVVEDMPNELAFKVAVDDMAYVTEEWVRSRSDEVIGDPDSGARRAYITASVRRRLHQRGFRERVLAAYSEQCALCRLRHRELLDAAHIVPDGEPGGDPIVRNGIAFCKLHHAAFDSFFLGIRPDYRVVVREDVLREKDGPMLLHGLQGLHNTRLAIPRKSDLRPDPGLLARRWERFEQMA
jgi:putative restriction endonuclease